MAQQRKAPVALAEDPGSMPSPHTVVHKQFQETSCLLLTSGNTRHECGTNIYMQANTHMHKIEQISHF